MKNEVLDYDLHFKLLPVHELEFILPSQEQVLALHHDWYVLPKKYGDGAVFNDENKEMTTRKMTTKTTRPTQEEMTESTNKPTFRHHPKAQTKQKTN